MWVRSPPSALLLGPSLQTLARSVLTACRCARTPRCDLEQQPSGIDVRLAYWELVHARAAVEVQRQSLELAEQLVRDNRVRVEIGMVGEIEVVQARAEAALRRQSLAEAVRVPRTNELAFKQLIVDGRTDELWNAEINPTDEPRTEAIPIDLDAAIRAALDRRTDINRVRRQIDINDARVENLRNSTLPALDLIGTYQLTGQGGPRLVPAGSSFEAILGGRGEVIPGGYRNAVGDIVGADYPFWRVQVQMTYPLGRSADEAAYERARLERRQNEAELDGSSSGSPVRSPTPRSR